MLCETTPGNISGPISIVFYAAEQTTPPTGTLCIPLGAGAASIGAAGSGAGIPLDLTEFETKGTYMYNSDTTEIVEIRNLNADIPVAYAISIGVLVAALIVCVVVSITVITIILRRSKARITISAQLDRAEQRESDEPMYESITGPLPSVSAISAITTQDNVAYTIIYKSGKQTQL
jgi:hypothetical protein